MAQEFVPEPRKQASVASRSAFFVLMGLKVDLSSLIEARRARSRSNLDRLRRYWKIGLRIGSRRIRYPPLGVGIGMVPREGWADFRGNRNSSNAGGRANSEPDCLFLDGADGATDYDHHR
jgi:hypothetical protein